MNLEQLINELPFILGIISAFLVGIPAGYKILIVIIRRAEAALEDGKITIDEFEEIIEEIFSLSTIIHKGIEWFLEKIKKRK